MQLYCLFISSAACRSYEFGCATGDQCVPQAWRCDGETDCLDGSDEQLCATFCAPGQVSCLSGDQCVDHQQLCDGTAHCRDASDESVDNCGALLQMENLFKFTLCVHKCLIRPSVLKDLPGYLPVLTASHVTTVHV